MDFSIPAAGMEAESTAFDRAASRIVRSVLPSSYNPSGNSQSVSDSLDLTTSALTLLEAKLGFESDAKTAEVENEMTKSTLRMLG